MKIMRLVPAALIVPLMAFVLVATAQEKSQKSEKASDTKTVTGCLQKGDERMNTASRNSGGQDLSCKRRGRLQCS